MLQVIRTMKMMSIYTIGLMVFLCLAIDVDAAKGVTARAAREMMDAAVQRSSSRAFSRLVRESPDQVLAIARRYGDDGLVAVSRHGRPAMRVLLNSSDEAAAPVLRMIQRHGDDAVRMGQSPQGLRILATENDTMFRVMHQTRGQAYPLLDRYGPRGADVLSRLSASESRQLIQLQRGRHFSDSQFRQILDVVGEYGDRALRFIWEHKGTLALASVFVAFVADPQPFIDGTKDLTGLVMQTAAEQAGETVRSVFAMIRWNVWIGVLLAVVGAKILIRQGWKMYCQRKACRVAVNNYPMVTDQELMWRESEQ